jgi:hypothetical protein
LNEWLLLQRTSPLLIVGKQPVVTSFSIVPNLQYYFVDVDDFEMRPHNCRVKERRSSLEWSNVQAVLLDICIAFYPLDLPPYVVLEIVDHFPFWSTHVNHKKKIDYIIQIKRFCDALIADRSKHD